MPTPYQPPKPLWHFGWRGYCLLPILLALIWVAQTGYNLQYQLQSLINDAAGPDVMFEFTIAGLIHHSVGLLDYPSDRPIVPFTQPGMNFAIPILIGLALHPVRIRRHPSLLVLLWFTIAIPIEFCGNRWLRHSLGVVDTVPWTWFEIGLDPVHLLVPFISFWIILRIMKQPGDAPWRLAAAGLLALAWLAESSNEFAARYRPQSLALWTFNSQLDLSIRAAWHLAWLALWLTWSIRARLHHIPPHACQHCAYDLRGLPDATPICPECGHSRPQATPESPAECPATATP